MEDIAVAANAPSSSAHDDCEADLEPEVASINVLPKSVLSQIFSSVPLVTLQKLGYVCSLWYDVQQFVISNSKYCICDDIMRVKNSDALCFAFVLTVSEHHQDDQWRLDIKNNIGLLKSVFANCVTELRCTCPEGPVDWTKLDGVSRETYQILKQFPNIETITLLNFEAAVLYMPAGRLTMRALFPNLQTIYWRYKSEMNYEIRVVCSLSNNFVPVSTFRSFDEDPWTSSPAIDHIQTYVEILKADAIANIGSCSSTISATIFRVLMPFSQIGFAARSCRASDLFGIITELNIIANEKQKLAQTLGYLTNLVTLGLDDEHKVSTILRVPHMPSVKHLILNIHDTVVDSNFLLNFPNLEKLEIHSDNIGAIWMEHLSASVASLPKLHSLEVDCFEDRYSICPKEVDSIITSALNQAPLLRTLKLGKGCQPMIDGLRNILAHPVLRSLVCRPADDNLRAILIALVSSLFATRIDVVYTTMSVSLEDLYGELRCLSPAPSPKPSAPVVNAGGSLPPKKRHCRMTPSEVESMVDKNDKSGIADFCIQVQRIVASSDDDLDDSSVSSCCSSPTTANHCSDSGRERLEVWVSWTDSAIASSPFLGNLNNNQLLNGKMANLDESKHWIRFAVGEKLTSDASCCSC